MDWFRMYGEMMDDPKIGTLSDSAFRTWVELLCCACKAEDEGNTQLTEETLNWALRRNVTEPFQQLFQRGLVTVNDAKEIVIAKWSDRQKKSDSSAPRVRRCREKAKLGNTSEPCNVTETDVKRYGNALEKSREEKKREEKKEEKSSARATRLPADWEPDAGQIAFCQTERPDLVPFDVGCRFRDYWIGKAGKDGAKLDWSATWRNWVRNERAQSNSANVAKFDPVAYVNRNRFGG